MLPLASMVPRTTTSRPFRGKIVETWVHWDRLSMMQQLGVVPLLQFAYGGFGKHGTVTRQISNFYETIQPGPAFFQGILVLRKERTLNVHINLEPKNGERPLILTSMKGALHEPGSISREFGPRLSR